MSIKHELQNVISAFIQLGISTVGYALLLPGIFGDFTAPDGKNWYNGSTVNYEMKYTLIGIGSALIAGNAIYGTIRPILYQFDKKFDVFYDINNEANWLGGF